MGLFPEKGMDHLSETLRELMSTISIELGASGTSSTSSCVFMSDWP